MAFTQVKLTPVSASSPDGSFDIAAPVPYTDASGATYKIGSPLVASGGDLVESTSPLNGTNKTVGIALQPGSNITGTHVSGSVGNAGVVTPLLFAEASDGTIFEGTIGNAGADYQILATDIWTSMGLTKDGSSGFWYVDKATSGGVLVIGLKFPQDVTFGTTYGARVLFKFLRGTTSY